MNTSRPAGGKPATQPVTAETAHSPAAPPILDARKDTLRAQKPVRTNLRLPRSPLIGRDHTLTIIQERLLQDEVGLLTLTGPGGIGKTRLALQAAANLLDHFVDGVYFVSLAPIRDAGLVGPTIAEALGLAEVGGRPMLEILQAYLAQRQTLLVLDNFEQVAAAAPLVGTLLAECPQLKALVTSRAALHLYEEQEYPVPPLALPNAKRLPSSSEKRVEALAQVAAVALFVRQAQAVQPRFALTEANAAAVADICLSLDGLPLAIELAAAKIKLFTPPALLARLTQRLALLTDGAQDLPERQRTLRDEIAWSYDLLASGDRKLFRRLAVFSGGFTLVAAHAICSMEDDAGFDVLNGVTTLLDQNLIRQMEGVDDEARFGMLENIREYAFEQLAESGEMETFCHRHALFFLTLAETLEPEMLGPNRTRGLARLEREIDNLRAVFTWSQTSPGSAELELRLAGALTWFAHFGNHGRETRTWQEAALQRSAAPTAARAKALWGAGLMAMIQGDAQTACIRFEASVALWRKLGDPRGLAAPLRELIYTSLLQGNVSEALQYGTESVSLWRTVGSQWDLGLALNMLGMAHSLAGDQATALALCGESLAVYRAVQDAWGIATTLTGLGLVSGRQGDYAVARARLEEAVVIWPAHEDAWSRAETLGMLGETLQQQGELARAGAVYAECLLLSHETGDWPRCAFLLRHFGTLAQAQGRPEQALHLFAAAERCGTVGSDVFITLVDSTTYTQAIATLRAQMDEHTFTTHWTQGQTMTLDQMIGYALAMLDTQPDTKAVQPAPAPPPSPYPGGLTAREVEVLRLLAQGHTYAQIAETLVISRRTVNGHLTSIYGKLGVSSRMAAARFAQDHSLL